MSTKQHEFVEGRKGDERCYFGYVPPDVAHGCGLIRSAPVHAASVEPQLCAQCESNANWNEAGGYKELAEKCRQYCRNGHKETPSSEATETIWIDVRPQGVNKYDYPCHWYEEKPRNSRYNTGVAEYILKSSSDREVERLRTFVMRVAAQPDWFNHCDNDAHDEKCACLNDAAHQLLEP